jgi:hypothetical protein
MVTVVVKQSLKASPKHYDDLDRRSKLEAEGADTRRGISCVMCGTPPHIYIGVGRGGGNLGAPQGVADPPRNP